MHFSPMKGFQCTHHNFDVLIIIYDVIFLISTRRTYKIGNVIAPWHHEMNGVDMQKTIKRVMRK